MMRSDTTATATQTDDGGNNIGRRTFVKGIGASAAAGAGLALDDGPVGSANALAPVAAAGLAFAGGAALRYAMLKYNETGTAYADLEETQNAARAYEAALDTTVYDDAVFTNLGNVLELSQNAAFGDARVAAIEQWNLENGETAGTDAGVAAIDDFFVTQQKNLLDHYSTQASKLVEAMSDGSVEYYQNGTAADHTNAGGNTAPLKAATLVDGSTYDYNQVVFNVDHPDWTNTISPEWMISHPDMDDKYKFDAVHINNPDGSGDEPMLEHGKFYDLNEQIKSLHSTTVSEFQTWATNVYASYTAGDISLTDITRPSDISQSASEKEGFSYAGADAALLGLKGVDGRSEIRLHQDEETVTGTIYLSVDREINVGQQYQPSDFAGPVYLAYEWDQYEDQYGETVEAGSELVEVQQPFTIKSSVDSDGNEVDTLSFTSRNTQDTTTEDVQAIQEELNQIRDLQDELAKEQEEIATSGGGGGFLNSTSNRTLGIVAGGAALAALLFGSN